jgi:hypothetical protein
MSQRLSRLDNGLGKRKLTGSASAVGLDKGSCNLAVLYLQGIAFAPGTAKNRSSVIKCEIKSLCELSSWVRNKSNL